MSRQERTTQQVKQIPVVDTAGKQHLIDEIVELIRVQSLDGTWSEWLEAGGYFLLNGEDVNPTNDPNVFELLETEELLTVIPQAPSKD